MIISTLLEICIEEGTLPEMITTLDQVSRSFRYSDLHRPLRQLGGRLERERTKSVNDIFEFAIRTRKRDGSDWRDGVRILQYSLYQYERAHYADYLMVLWIQYALECRLVSSLLILADDTVLNGI